MSNNHPQSLKKRLALAGADLPFIGPAATALYLRRKYGARVVTPAKVRNFIQAQKDLAARAVTVQSRPWIINLDTFNGCNLKCPFCPTGTSQIERAKARMSVERAMRVIDMVKEHALEIRLYNWGEPFLNPDIFKIVRYAHDAGLYTIINSNLSVKVADFASKVVASKLDRLQASVDGISQQTLEIYRRNSNAELVFSNIKSISEERRRQGASTPKLALSFLVFRHNEHELPAIEAKRREVGADDFLTRRAFIFHESFVPQHPDYQPTQAVFHGTCDFLYSEMTVEATGAVSPCCTNMSEKWDIGTVDGITSIHEYWNNPIYRAMRAFVGGKGSAATEAPGQKILCKHCSLVAHPRLKLGRLSPLPPAFQAAGISYNHGLDELQARHFGDHG